VEVEFIYKAQPLMRTLPDVNVYILKGGTQETNPHDGWHMSPPRPLQVGGITEIGLGVQGGIRTKLTITRLH
jgi:hypothetical protein